jgi:hypothetical protein
MKNKAAFSYILACLIFLACQKDNNNYSEREYLKQWSIPVTTSMVTPATANRADSGTLQLVVLSDNKIRFDFRNAGLSSGDALTGAHIHAGDPVSNGPIVLNLNPRISSTYLSGEVSNVRQSLIDSLLNPNVHLYFDVHTTLVPTGVARGQLNLNIINSWNIALTGREEVPPVTTTATGNADLRLTSDSILFSRVTVANVETNDTMTMAHIHTGARGVNGPILVTLVASPAEFRITKRITLSSGTASMLVNNRTYVNAHSVRFPAGKVRGQIRE